MGRKKNPENNYFHSGVEEAIHLYNTSESELERNRIFRIIYPALAKISEVYYNKIKPAYIDGEMENIIMDCTSYLSERLSKIKQGKGKAFSYMTVCARNYYIFHNQRGYTGTKKTLKLDTIDENWDIVDDRNEIGEKEKYTAELLYAFADYLEANIDNMTTASARKFKPVLQEVINLIRNIDDIEDFNRRNIMNSLTTIDGKPVDRHYITKVFNKITVHYENFKREWYKSEKPVAFLDKSELSKNEIEFCIENYCPTNRAYSIVGLSRKFGVEEYTVRKELHKVGLASL